MSESNQWLKKWHVAPSTSQPLAFLDGIRGWAILMVVASHVVYVNPASSKIVNFIGGMLGAGAVGVPVFFALSGYLISLPFWKRKARNESVLPKGYYLRRFWKIYPPLALSVVLLLPVHVWLHGDALGFAKTVGQWLSGTAFFMPVSGKFNPVMWSLIVEVHFYLILPLIFLATRRLQYGPSLVLIGLLFCIVPAVCSTWYASR